MRMRRYAPILIVAMAAGCGPCGYNRIVNEEQQVEAAWSQVENQLQRRADLIPNLVEVVKGYAKHEKGVFDDIANARAAMLGASSRADKIQTANQFEGAISKLMSLTENYPNLKADANFQRRLALRRFPRGPDRPRARGRIDSESSGGGGAGRRPA